MKSMKDIIIGMSVGDAVGVPYEFIPRTKMNINPCTDMIGGGTHGQPIGTWSDDTSMALCIVDSLSNGLNYSNIANKFSEWLYDNLWTPHGEVFDNGMATRKAIDKWRTGDFHATECGGTDVASNGNGSVMRTLALVPYIEKFNPDIRYKVVSEVSSITHGHWISKLSCFLVCEYAIALRQGFDKFVSFDIAVGSLEVAVELEEMFETLKVDEYNEVFGKFINLIRVAGPKDDDFSGSGYARDTAMTSIWCVLTTNTYKEAVLKAVNYGNDTDTTACVTGGLAGILYGVEGIPTEWVDNLARKNDIIELIEKYDATNDTI